MELKCVSNERLQHRYKSSGTSTINIQPTFIKTHFQNGSIIVLFFIVNIVVLEKFTGIFITWSEIFFFLFFDSGWEG